MEFKHVSVLTKEVIEGLSIDERGTYIDGTLGGGGHGAAICRRLKNGGNFIGIDRDVEAVNAATAKLEVYGCNKHFFCTNYGNVKGCVAEANVSQVDGAVLDLGVSSYQLDNPERGFSYINDAPLDMRMNKSNSIDAKYVVNTYTENGLKKVIKGYGEERWAARIAKYIIEARKSESIETTGQLTEIIKKAIPAAARREGPHPAKRTFQAIRIEVNGELSRLPQAVESFCDILSPGGRLCIITFHSLEDRIVKETFAKRSHPCTCPPNLPVCACGKVADIKKITGKPLVPDEKEVEENPRARSAKLRIIQKL